jgi:hypothetical protein
LWSLGGRPHDSIVPTLQDSDYGLRAARIGAMDKDHPDLKGPAVESRLFQQGHDRHDGVVPAQVVVEPEFVDLVVPMLFEKQDALMAGTGDLRGPRQSTQIVNAKDDRHPCF